MKSLATIVGGFSMALSATAMAGMAPTISKMSNELLQQKTCIGTGGLLINMLTGLALGGPTSAATMSLGCKCASGQVFEAFKGCVTIGHGAPGRTEPVKRMK